MDAADVAVLVPVKAFSIAKGRLAGVISAEQRRRLARDMAGRVVRAAGEAPVYVACDDEEVREWATASGAIALWLPGRGLNGAVSEGRAEVCARGHRFIVVSHSDLPMAHSLPSLVDRSFRGVTFVPDRHDDGTNVMVLPADCRFEFSYGAGSFHRHLDVARRMRVPTRVCRHPRLALDIDTPADLAHPLARPLVEEVLAEWLPTNPANRR